MGINIMIKNIKAKILTAVQKIFIYPFRLCYVAILNVLLLALFVVVTALKIFTFLPVLSGYAEAAINEIRILITFIIIPGAFYSPSQGYVYKPKPNPPKLIPYSQKFSGDTLSFVLYGNGNTIEYIFYNSTIYLPHLSCEGLSDASFTSRVDKYAEFIKNTIIANSQLKTLNFNGHSMGGAILAAAIAKILNGKDLEDRNLTFNLDIDRTFDNLPNVVDVFLGYGVFKPIFTSSLSMLGLTLDTEHALQKIIQEIGNHKVNIKITTCSDDQILGDGALTAANIKSTNPKVDIKAAIINVGHNSPGKYDVHRQLQDMDSNFDMKYHKDIYLALDFVLAVVILQLYGVFAMLDVAVMPLLVGPFFAAIMPQLVFSICLVLGLHAFTNACSFAASSFVINDSRSYDLANREEARSIKKGYYSEVGIFSVLICALLPILKILPFAAMSFNPVLLLPVLFGVVMLLATFIADALPAIGLAADSSQSQANAAMNKRGGYLNSDQLGRGNILGGNDPFENQSRDGTRTYNPLGVNSSISVCF